MGIKYMVSKYWWFLVLIIVAALFCFRNHQWGTLNPKEINFSYDNMEKVTRIDISDIHGSISLTKIEDQWSVGKAGHAAKKPVSDILLALSQIRVAAPIPISLRDSLVAELLNHGTKISLYSHKRLVKAFVLLEIHGNGTELVGMLSQSKNPYKLELSGIPDNNFNPFSTQVSHWISKRFALPHIENLTAVEVEIPSNPKKSYRLDIINSHTIKLVDLYSGHGISQFDTLKAAEFLQNLCNISYKEKLADLTDDEMASILLQQPEFIFNFYPINGVPIILKFIPVPIDEYMDEFGRTVSFDPNSLYVNLDDRGELYKISYMDCYHILKEISYFNPIF